MEDYFIKKDGRQVINPRLVLEDAEKYAKMFLEKEEIFNEKTKKTKIYKGITSAQLRKFYGAVKGLELRLRDNPEDSGKIFAEILPLIKLLKAKSAYALGREVVPPSFNKWMSANVAMINEIEDFKAFLLHFEAVVGFCYGMGLKD